MKTATRTKTKVHLSGWRKGGAMERVQRSLKEIEADIRGEISLGMKHFQKVGKLLLEGKAVIYASESHRPQIKFQRWAEEQTGRSLRQVERYMAVADGSVGRVASLSEAAGDTRTWSDRSESIREDQWEEIFERAKKNVDAATRETLIDLEEDRGEEKRQADLAERLINTGYKTLATTLHPDKGGSQEEMARLNLVKHLLLEVVEEIRG